MPPTVVLFYQDDQEDVPVLKRLNNLRDKQAIARMHERIERLEDQGYALGRPPAPLRDQISELRARSGTVQYRILYCFYEQQAILLHGLTKEGEVPDQAIRVAAIRRRNVFQDPKRHIYDPTDEDNDIETE